MRYLLKLLGGMILTVFICSAVYSDNNNSTNSEMVLVPGGTFQMGNIFSGGNEDELPVHEVTLDSFYIGKNEVTVGEFGKFVNATGYKTTAETDGGADVFDGTRMVHDSSACWRKVNFKQNNDHPVIFISWYDAVAYCNWLSTREGLEPCYSREGDNIACNFEADGYRLPTEAEYEYAARCGGRDYKYAWGNGEPYINDIKAANILDETALREWGGGADDCWHGYDDKFDYTSPVGTFAPSEQGLYDMSGNVFEWCWDRYAASYYRNSPIENPRGPDRGEMRSYRDAGYDSPPDNCRAAGRGKAKPGDRFHDVGFRLVRAVG